MIKSRLESFKFAFEGVLTLVKEEINFRIHCVITLIVIGFGIYFDISRIEWVLLVLVITIVFVAEGLNTAIECLCDRVTQDLDPLIKKSKDIAAAAVFMSAIGAVIIGALIFSRYL